MNRGELTMLFEKPQPIAFTTGFPGLPSAVNACRELLASGPMVVDRPDLDDRFSWEAMARKVLSLCA